MVNLYITLFRDAAVPEGSTLKMGFSKKNEEKFLGHCRRPIYTNSQPFKLIGVSTLGADIPTYKQTSIHRQE